MTTQVLFSSTIGVTLLDKMGSDAGVIAAARVSTKGAESLEGLSGGVDEGKGLINFLMKNRHGTPFEHNAMTFFVHAPIFVYREFHRHRIGWSYNEESGRYKQLDPLFYLPSKHRNLEQVGKPGAYQFVPGTPEQYEAVFYGHGDVCQQAYDNYEKLLALGIAKEVARMSLPVNIYSSQYATCNARSMMAFLSLRTNHPESMFPSSPLREIEMVAEKMEMEFAHHFPIIYEAFERNGRVCP